jgi:phosphoglycolate phosphatase
MERGERNPVVDAVLRSAGAGGHVIWDWNGTLLADVDHAIEVMNRMLDERGMPTLDRERYTSVFDFPVRRYYDALGFDYAQETFESLCHRFMERFMAGASRLRLFPRMEAAVRDLKRRGFVQSILSATEQETLETMIGDFGLRDVFMRVFGIPNRLAASKLERGRELLHVSRIEPACTVLVGDTLHDLEVANELGTHLVLVDHGHHSRLRLSTGRLRPSRCLHLV